MIRYYNENVTFSLSGKRFNNRWLKAVAESENFSLGNISIIYCSDSYILDIMKNFSNTTIILTLSLLTIARAMFSLVIYSLASTALRIMHPALELPSKMSLIG